MLTAASGVTSRRTTKRARIAENCSVDQRAWEKNRCARRWLQVCDSRAPTSIPHTVRRALWASSPQASAQNTGNVHALKQPRNSPNNAASDGGTGTSPGSCARTLPCCLPLVVNLSMRLRFCSRRVDGADDKTEEEGAMQVNARRQAKQRKLGAQLAEIGFALPGSLTVKAYRCGKQNLSLIH